MVQKYIKMYVYIPYIYIYTHVSVYIYVYIYIQDIQLIHNNNQQLDVVIDGIYWAMEMYES